MKCREQNNEFLTCSLAVNTDRYKLCLFSANLTNFNHAIWMVNRSDVNERETPNCVKTGNARVMAEVNMLESIVSVRLRDWSTLSG